MDKLGAVALSDDILTKANIGLWAFELDEGEAPRMYVNETMLGLIGLDHQVSPEETYHAWYDHIDEGSYGLVSDSVEKMASGEHAEVQYPWHHPDGRTMVVRCGGVRNPEYTRGIRIEGTHQDVTAVLHFNEEQRKQKEKEILEPFIANYSVVFKVRLPDGALTPFKFDSDAIGYGTEFTDYAEVREFFLDKVVYEPDREKLRQETETETIRRRLEKEPAYSVEYRAVIDKVAVWEEMEISALSEDEIAVGFAVKDFEILNRHISQALMNSYEGVAVVNLNTDQLKLLKMTGATYGKSKVVTNSRLLREMALNLKGDARAYYLSMADTEYHRRLLMREGRTEFVYQSPNYEGGPVWLKVETQVLTKVGDVPETAVIVVSRVDSVQREKIELNERLLEALDEVTEEKNRFATAAELINSANWSFGLNDNDEVVSAEFYGDPLRILGIDLKISPHAWEEILHPDDKEMAMKAFKATISDHSGQTPYDVDYRMRDRNGKYNWFRSAGKIIRKPDGSREFFGIHINIEERVKADMAQQAQLEEALAEAQLANRAKTEFLFNMSHDVRTPMNAILGFTSIAERHIDDREKVADCLEKTRQSGNLLLSLINGVLDMSRIEQGIMESEEQAGDVFLCFAGIESTLLEEAEKKDINLSFGVSDIYDRYVYADFTRCLRIFTNLITNSLKYTKEGGHVEVRCTQVAPQKDGRASYRFTVEDNGIGMSEEFQEKMFESFTRERSSTTSGIQGTGLGLSVCKTFVDYLGGTIECESEPDRGTKFTVILPFRLQEGTDYTDPVSGAVKTAQEEEVPGISDFRGRRVLLVEDNELNREIALEILEDEGLVVDEAEDGSVAVEILREKGPDYYDFILMDIQMPVMDGYEATRAIRAMYPDAKIPVIAVSANAFEEDKAASIAAGMDDHVAKPINVQELFGCLGRHL